MVAAVNLSGRTLKGYELTEEIDSGGFGVVYRAFQPSVSREVAIKVILPEYANQPAFIRRFEAEAQVVARLEHFHIVPLYDYWRDPDGAYLVMRLLKGGRLGDHVRDRSLNVKQISTILDQVASALAVAHRQGVVHRDIKPGNILLDEACNAFLTDFGIAKTLAADGSPLEDSGHNRMVGSPLYLSPEQARGELVSPMSDQYALGVVIWETLAGQHPFENHSMSTLLYSHLNEDLPDITEHRPDLPEMVNEVLRRATAKKPVERYPDMLMLAGAFRRAVGPLLHQTTSEQAVTTVRNDKVEALPGQRTATITPPELTNPYKGLRAFQEADAADFFGREATTRRLLDRLQEQGETSRFLAVVGPSGSGKSSVVKAGLIPALRGGAIPGSENWYMVDMTPGAQPMKEMEAALLSVAVHPPPHMLDELESDTEGLLRVAQAILPCDNGSQLLLLIDQFEEIFTQVEDEATRLHFLESLAQAVTAECSPLRIIITLRADFYDRPLRYLAFGELVRERMETVLPLSPAEIERAVVGPAERIGLMVEPALAAAIVADVSEEPGALPLLQYCLTELFERRRAHALTLQTYQAMGGALGALARRAEELYLSLNESSQRVARQMFLRLVTLGEGTEDTRRRVLFPELNALDAGNGVMRGVINLYQRQRLLTFDNDPITRAPTIELAHEALIGEWGRLRDWLEDSREDVRLQRRLMNAANEWQNAGYDASYLIRGARLDQIEQWSHSTSLALGQIERDYVAASMAEREAQAAAEAKRKAREESLERRARRVLQVLLVVLLIATAGALMLTAFAFNEQSRAEDARATSELNAERARHEANNAAEAQATSVASAGRSRSLALAVSAQQALKNGDNELAIALSLAAYASDELSMQTRQALAAAAYAPGTRQVFTGHRSPVVAVAYSPDGRYGVSGSGRPVFGAPYELDNSLRVWDLETGEPVRVLGENNVGHLDSVRALAFTPDGRYLISGGFDQMIIVWDFRTGEIVRRIRTSRVWDIAVGPNGQHLLSGSVDGNIRLWDIASGKQLLDIPAHPQGVRAVVFSPDGSRAYSTAPNDDIIEWDLATGGEVRRFIGHNGGAASLTLSPDGRWLLSGGYDTLVKLWNVETGRAISTFYGHTAAVVAVDFDPTSPRMLTAGYDNTIILWDLNTNRELLRFTDHDAAVIDASFSPSIRQDDDTLLSGSADGTVRLWSLTNEAESTRFVGATAPINQMAFSPDGRQLLVAAADTRVRLLWNLDENGAEARNMLSFVGHNQQVNSVAFSPDGGKALSGSQDSTLILWDIESGEQLQQLVGHVGGVLDVAYGPYGRYVLSGAQDNTLRLWDLTTGMAIRRLTGHSDDVTAVAFSPDGRRLLSGSDDQTMRLWDAASAEQVMVFSGHNAAISDVAFSPDGRFVLSASLDNTAILWDIETGEPVQTFVGHNNSIQSVAFSPDGRFLLTASDDTTLRLWDIESGIELQRFSRTGNALAVGALALSPDGQRAAVASTDRIVSLWQITTDPQDWIEQAFTNRYVRQLTCAERRLYQVEPLCGEGDAMPTRTPFATHLPSQSPAASPTPLTGLNESVTPSPFPTLTPTVTFTPGPTATLTQNGRINLGQTVSSTMAAGGRYAWTFSGEAGQVINIAFNSIGGEIEVFGVNGAVLFARGPASELEPFTLEHDGQYTIVVHAGDARGPYGLTVSDLTPVVPDL